MRDTHLSPRPTAPRSLLPAPFSTPEFDPFTPPESLAKTFTQLGTTDRRWVTIPNADHAAHLEHPDRFVREIIGFVQRGS